MRKVYIKSVEGDFDAELGREVELVARVMQLGKYINSLTYEAELSGNRVITLINKYNGDKSLLPKIKRRKKYIVTAYDW